MKASRGPLQPKFSELPDQLPIVFLPEMVLLPGWWLPLSIRRPSCMSLVHDALVRPYRLVGLTQIREKAEDDKPGNIYGIGCAGRITSFAEKSDEHITISLFGTARFRLFEYEEQEVGYPLGRVSWDEFRSDLTPDEAEIDRKQLMDVVQKYMDIKGFKPEHMERLQKCENERLVTVMTMGFPLETHEKQVLLESPTLASRAELLTAILEKACYDENDEQSTNH